MTPCKFSHTLCHIDLGALKRNFLRCGNPAMLMPVLKSDAYGHGLLECARALASVGAERFAVGCADEGRALLNAYDGYCAALRREADRMYEEFFGQFS